MRRWKLLEHAAAPFIALFTSIACPTVTTAQLPSDAPSRVQLRESRSIPLAGSGIAGTDAIPVVEVMVNGRGPFRFGVETGAGFIGVSREFAAAQGLRVRPGTSNPEAFVIDSITLPGATFSDVPVLALPRAATGVVGILGLPFFSDVLLTIDYPNRTLTLATGALKAGADVLPLASVGPFRGIPVRYGALPYTAVLDTRSMSTLSMSPRTADSVRFVSPPVVAGMARGAGFAESEIKMGTLLDTVRIGEFSLVNAPVTIHQLPPNYPQAPIIGSGALRNFTMTLDLRNQRVQLRRTGGSVVNIAAAPGPQPVVQPSSAPGAPQVTRQTVTQPPAPAGSRSLGVGFGLVGPEAMMRVEFVQPGSLGETVGFKVGDAIEEIDGRKATGFPQDELRTLIRGTKAFDVAVTRNGQRIRLRVP